MRFNAFNDINWPGFRGVAAVCYALCGLAAVPGLSDDAVFDFSVAPGYTNLYRGSGSAVYSPGYSTFTNFSFHHIRGPGPELDWIHSLYAFSEWGFNFGYQQGITNPWAPYDRMLELGEYDWWTDPSTVVVYRVGRVDVANAWEGAFLTWSGTNSTGGNWGQYLPVSPFNADGYFTATNGALVYSGGDGVGRQFDKPWLTSTDTLTSVQHPILWRSDDRTAVAVFQQWGCSPTRVFRGETVTRREIYEITGTVYQAKREKWPDFLVTVTADIEHHSPNEPNEEYWAPVVVSNHQYRVPDYASITSAWGSGVSMVKKYRVNRTYRLRIMGDQ